MVRKPILKYLILSMTLHFILGFFVLGILVEAVLELPTQKASLEPLFMVQLSDLSISFPNEAPSPSISREQPNRLADVTLTSLPVQNPGHSSGEAQDSIRVESTRAVIESQELNELRVDSLQHEDPPPTPDRDASALKNPQEEMSEVSEIIPAGHAESLSTLEGLDSTSPEYIHFISEVRFLLEQAKRYPWLARTSHLEGTVTLGFLIDSAGLAHDIHIVTSSTHRILDESAVLIVKGVSRFPQPPGKSGIQLIVPLDFSFSKQ